MYIQLRFVGTSKKRVTWNSMGECFVYVVEPGEVISVPVSQANNAKAIGPFVEVHEKTQNVKRKKNPVAKVKKIFEKESSEVVTESDVEVFTKQNKLNPFEKYETLDERIEIPEESEETDIQDISFEDDEEDKSEEDADITEVTEEEKEEENSEEEDREVTETQNTDFSTFNKSQLADWLIEHGVDETSTQLMKNKRDTLISMCVNKEKTL